MKNFQKYFFEATKIYEFRIKVAGANFDKSNSIESIKNALNAYRVETISKPRRLPISEHKEFPALGPCECHLIDVSVCYPTTPQQVRQLIVERSAIPSSSVVVYTKDQHDQMEEIDTQIEADHGALISDPELKDVKGAQELVGEKRFSGLMKELETRKYEIAGGKGETSVEDAMAPGVKSPVGSKQNTVIRPRGKK